MGDSGASPLAWANPWLAMTVTRTGAWRPLSGQPGRVVPPSDQGVRAGSPLDPSWEGFATHIATGV